MADTLIEFEDLEHCRAAAVVFRGEGVRVVDAYLPFPDAGVLEALELPKSPLPKVVGASALLGGLVAYVIQWWTNAVDYPLDVGGRPVHPAPSFLLITFETAVLFGAMSAFFGLCFLCRLPRPHHPLFEIPGFERASVDRYFLLVNAGEAQVAPLLDSNDYARMLSVEGDS